EEHHHPEVGPAHFTRQATARRSGVKGFSPGHSPPMMGATMSEPTREELLTLALGVLPEPPQTVDVLSEDGGCFPLVIAGLEDDMLFGYAPRHAVRLDLHLLARVFYPERGRYEVEFEMIETYFHSTQ